MHSIVFLDVDGVLTHIHYENPKTRHINPSKVKLLKELCDCTNAKIVITSSWRGSEQHTPACYYVLRHILSNAGIQVIADAPYIPAKDIHIANQSTPRTLDQFANYHMQHGTGRAAEVQAYLNTHPTKAFVILDDEDFNWADYQLDTHWIQPSWYGDALTKAHVKQAISILKQ